MNRPVDGLFESWQKIADTGDEASYPAAWLTRLVHAAGGVEAAVLVLGEANVGPFRPVALWPDEGSCPQELAVACERVMETRLALTARGERHLVVAQPVLHEGQLYGVLACAVDAGQGPGELKRCLDWSLGWLLLHIQRGLHGEPAALRERLLTTLDLSMLALGEQKAAAATQAVLTEMAVRLNCDRVSVGFAKGALVHFAALSHAADTARRVDLTHALEAAMNEAAEQGERILLSEAVLRSTGDSPVICREHERLLRNFGTATVLSVPFAVDEEKHGVFVFEWAAEAPPEESDLAEGLAVILGRVLLDKRHADRGFWQRLRDFAREEKRRLIGPLHGERKLIAGLVAFVVIFFTLAHGDHRVAAQSSLEGGVRRQIVAPYDGFVATAQARAGQQVEAGALLATLDDRDLRLETQRWASQQEQYNRQAADAEAQSNLAQIQIALAQTRQAAAQRELSESQLERSRVVAPFAGVITAGDLSQQLGGAVKKGQTLFEIAPLDSYRIVLEVEEADISWLNVGQKGKLVVTALPGEQFAFTTSLVTPVAKAREGRNFFRVEATLDEFSPRLRPGMEGIAKVVVGERRLIWIWTHAFFDWLRLQTWMWLGV